MESLRDKSIHYKNVKAYIYHLRFEATTGETILAGLGLATLTGLLAQIRIPLPFTPVPITGQVFAVLLSGLLFGRRSGGLSQLFYVSLGVMGLPWFTGLSGGWIVLTGPTGGYLLGFIMAAGFMGWLTDIFITKLRWYLLLGTSLVGICIIYLFGVLHLWLFYETGFLQAITYGVVPFIWVDLLKALIVSLLVPLALSPYT